MNIMGYVILLSNESYSNRSNDYGYWTGKNYSLQGEYFPVCDTEKNLTTKIYTSKKRAESMAQKLLDRCDYVTGWKVEESDQAAPKKE